MGFTQPDPDLFHAWASYRAARSHLMDFVDSVQQPLLEVLLSALHAVKPETTRAALADFATRGKIEKRVLTKLTKVMVEFCVPAGGPVRVAAGMHAGYGQPLFAVELRSAVPEGAKGDAASRVLIGGGFEEWRPRWLWRPMPLPDELIASTDLQQSAIEFCRDSFEVIARSGVLDLEVSVASPPDDEEEGA